MHKCTLHIYVYTHIAYLSISIYTYRERDVYTCIRHTYMYMCIIYRERERYIHVYMFVCAVQRWLAGNVSEKKVVCRTFRAKP